MLLNKERAYDVMRRNGLDGLVAVERINVYYLTDYWGPLMRMGRRFYNYAVLPLREDAPAAVVLTGTELNRLHHAPDATWVPNVCSYVHPVYQDRRDFDPDVEDPEAVEHGMKWPVDYNNLSPDDEAFLRFTEGYRGRHSVNALYGLKKAIVDAGLTGAVVGSDDPRIGPWLSEVGLPDLKVREATSLFREIRMVKTEPELELLRAASRMNEQALGAVIGSIDTGMQRSDLEIIFNMEIARQGGHAIYLATGQRGTNNNRGEIAPHESLTFDALCEYKNYHGDLGRVAVLGQPRPDLARRMEIMQLGSDIAFDMIRPGVSGRAVTEAVLGGMRKSGFESFFFATPHSLGLEHSDHPLPIGPQLPGAQGEFLFLENMTFSLDMPYYEVGWGNLHVEDAVRVTATGVELLTSGDVSLRVVEPGSARPIPDRV